MHHNIRNPPVDIVSRNLRPVDLSGRVFNKVEKSMAHPPKKMEYIFRYFCGMMLNTRCFLSEAFILLSK